MQKAKAQQYREDDPHFLDDLDHSQVAVETAAAWLSQLGYPTLLHPSNRKRPSEEEMGAQWDAGDLSIQLPVEVKQRKNITFTGAHDYPYKKTFMVTVCHPHDRALPKPLMYLIFNRELTHLAVIHKSTYPLWTKVKKFDKQKNRERSFYECPLSLVKFFKL